MNLLQILFSKSALKILRISTFCTLFIFISKIGFVLINWEEVIPENWVIKFSYWLDEKPTAEDKDASLYTIVVLVFAAITAALHSVLIQAYFIYKGSRSILLFAIHSTCRTLSITLKIYLSVFFCFFLFKTIDYDNLFGANIPMFLVVVIFIIHFILTLALYMAVMRCVRPVWRKLWN